MIEEDEAEKELHSALSKARKLKQKKEGSSVSKVRLVQSRFFFYITCTCTCILKADIHVTGQTFVFYKFSVGVLICLE